MRNEKEASVRIFEALSGVDEAYLAACEESALAQGLRAAQKRERFVRRYGLAAAAVLCVAVMGVSGYVLRGAGYMGRNADSSEKNLAFMSFPAREEGIADMEAASVLADEPARAGAGAVENMSALKDTDDTTYAIGQTIQGNTESITERSEKEIAQEQKTDGTEPVKTEGDQSDSQQSAYRDMSLEEAKKLAVAGEFLPKKWMKDGRVESVQGSDLAGKESLRVTWMYENRWDSFWLFVDNLGSDLPDWVQASTADRSQPESYDQNLYEIPYAGTVPQEYWTVFNDPVFRADDFTKECVAARMTAPSGDAGDTDTPRGMFGVLYRDGDGNYVLVRFNGKGSADDVWEMMDSIR